MELRILVIEDDENTRHLIENCLEEEQYQLIMMPDGESAEDYLKAEQVDAIITDVGLPGIQGDVIVKQIHESYPYIPIMVITGNGSVDGAVRLINLGASDYLTKPFTRQVLKHRMHMLAKQVELSIELGKLQNKVQRDELESIVGHHPTMRRLMAMIPSVAQTDASVLILGESGTGKEMMARAIHNISKRSARKFVALNCGALPEQLMESELFGYKKGAFTDAKQDRPGLLEEADLGTLFLDEVGEMNMSIQVKFLRFLQEKEYRPLGSNVNKKVNVRIISATNKNLQKMVQEGTFREDLYYRLNVVPVQLPPLRERSSDVPILVAHYLQKFGQEYEKPIEHISQDLLNTLTNYRWPGNIRELVNTVQRLVIMNQGNILNLDSLDNISFMGGISRADYHPEFEEAAPKYLEQPKTVRKGPINPFKEEKEQVIASFERRYIKEALKASGGNISAAARMAKMDRKNFWQLMKKYAIESEAADTGHDKVG